jgi:hypothetical protein
MLVYNQIYVVGNYVIDMGYSRRPDQEALNTAIYTVMYTFMYTFIHGYI